MLSVAMLIELIRENNCLMAEAMLNGDFETLMRLKFHRVILHETLVETLEREQIAA